MQNSVPEVAQEAVLVQSGQLPVEPVEVKGYDFNQGIDHHKLLQSFRTSGFQATNFGLAVEEINKMVCECSVIDVSFNTCRHIRLYQYSLINIKQTLLWCLLAEKTPIQFGVLSANKHLVFKENDKTTDP